MKRLLLIMLLALGTGCTCESFVEAMSSGCLYEDPDYSGHHQRPNTPAEVES